MNLSHLHERIYPNSQVPYLRQFWDHGDVPGPKKKSTEQFFTQKNDHIKVETNSQNSPSIFHQFLIIRKATLKEIVTAHLFTAHLLKSSDWQVIRHALVPGQKLTHNPGSEVWSRSSGSDILDPTSVIPTFSLQALYNWIWVMSHEGYSTDWLDWMALLFPHFQIYYIAILHWRVLTIISAQRIPASSCYFTCSGFRPVVVGAGRSGYHMWVRVL